MHSAPSVSYPVGRSRGAARILIAAWVLGACCAGAAGYVIDSNGWRELLLGLSVLFAGGAAGFGLRSDRPAQLRFDGLLWHLAESGSGHAVIGAAHAAVALDLQSLLLIRLTAPQATSRWIWAEQRAMPVRWRDLRRAVYSRAPAAAAAGGAGERMPLPMRPDPLQ